MDENNNQTVDTTATVETTTTETTEPKVEQTNNGEKTFTQSEVDAMMKKRLDRADKKATDTLLEEFGIKDKDEFRQLITDTRTLSTELSKQREALETKQINDVFANYNVQDQHVKDRFLTLAKAEVSGTITENLGNIITEFQGFGVTQVGVDTSNKASKPTTRKYNKF